MKRLLFDTEGDGLLPIVTKIHCIAACDPDTGEEFDWKPDELPRAYEVLEQADKLYAHHGLGYDFPAMEKVDGFKVPFEKQGDTVVISRLIYPNLKDTDGKLVEKKILTGDLHGSYSIKAWGLRLGEQKGDFDGPWDVWTPVMHDYMIQDVRTLRALWNHLNPDNYSQQAIELEHRIQRLCLMMTEAGWPFDELKAQKLHSHLMELLTPIERRLREEFGFWFVPKSKKTEVIQDPITKQAVEVAEWFVPKVNNAKRGYVKGQACTKLERIDFNPASRQHAIRCLRRLGWKPSEFTDNGQPKLNDAVLEKLADQFPQGTALVEFLLINKRIGQVATGDQAWLKQVGPDGKMHGTINPMGTQSSRASHSNPNLGQVPASKNPYGHECRELFTVPKGWKLIGADQGALQLRCLGHYLAPFDRGEYGQAVAHGDPHWRAVQAIGFTTDPRDKANGLHEIYREKGAKTLTYATVFGCRDQKAGSIIRDCCTTARAKNPEWAHVYKRYFGRGETDRQVGGPIRERFYKALGLKPLLKKLERIRKDPENPFPGSVPGLDARWVPARTDHSTLANLLQSAEAILCKQWVCATYDALIAAGYRWGWDGDFVFVSWVHDEINCAVREELVAKISSIIEEAGKKAGEPFEFRVPLAVEARVGRNWAEVH